MPVDPTFSLNELLGIFVAQATLVGFGIAGVRWVVKAEIADRLSRLEALEEHRKGCERNQKNVQRELGQIEERLHPGRGRNEDGED